VRLQLDLDDHLRVAAFSALLVLWMVDPATEAVDSLFMHPTIGDGLSVDSAAPFTHFVDYLIRDPFIASYAQLTAGAIEQWIGDLRILRMGQTYEWHRMVIVASGGLPGLFAAERPRAARA
jgi:hypothetical protein